MLKTIHVLGWAEGVQPKRFRLHGRMAEIVQTLTAVERSTQFFTQITCCFSLSLGFCLANCAWFEAHSALQAESQQHGLSRALDLEFSNPESWPSCGLDAAPWIDLQVENSASQGDITPTGEVVWRRTWEPLSNFASPLKYPVKWPKYTKGWCFGRHQKRKNHGFSNYSKDYIRVSQKTWVIKLPILQASNII